ncbi:aminomethyl-transferring glycine dehydrogenase subunit GcvPA [Thalassoglobus sp. JC818]|uniref:aminomethyl-transferring glycine dehydrogenase subunit GcvPA n=1 Tax=Thalassoglobus sp. JC818 TaxID=3232136 RepID=UPI003457C70B
MGYLYNTPEQEREMLDVIGCENIEQLLEQVPADLQLKGKLDLPEPMTELDLQQHLTRLAALNHCDRVCFRGGGAYDHFVPAVVDEIAGRGEFYTAYTPYQPEASQGSLQAFFEYQSLICALTGFDVSNASLYEGGTAVSEAAFMAMRVTRREGKILLSEGVHPEFRQVVETYTRELDTEVITIPTVNGVTDLNRLKEVIDDQVACVVFQQPNFFGCIEPGEEICEIAREHGALSVVSFDPLSLGVLKRPADYGADIGVAEGQSLGIPLQYGGPYLGVLACREEFVRKMPGRLISLAKDRDGKQCYVLGLQTREQHIRRDKATSNICTNQGLLALRATVYLSLMGPEGLREAATLSCQKAHYAAERLQEVDGLALAFDGPFFKEFTLSYSGNPDKLVQRAADAGFDIGPSLKQFPGAPESAQDSVLIAVTETRTKDQIDALVSALKE